jgi:hypothetical protein
MNLTRQGVESMEVYFHASSMPSWLGTYAQKVLNFYHWSHFTVSIIIIIIVVVVVIMPLQPFVGPWPLFQFPGPAHSRQDSLGGGSARRKASTYTQNNTNIAFERAKTVHGLDRAATVIG